MSIVRLLQIEKELEREDLTDEQWSLLNKEANSIQDQINNAKKEKDRLKAIRLEEEKAEAELAKVLALTEEQVEEMYKATCIKYQDVNGMSFKSWYEQSLTYYTIDEQYNVHARARSEDTVEVVAHPTLAQAKLTILRRIKYKFYDHAVRGHDFAW